VAVAPCGNWRVLVHVMYCRCTAQYRYTMCTFGRPIAAFTTTLSTKTSNPCTPLHANNHEWLHSTHDTHRSLTSHDSSFVFPPCAFLHAGKAVFGANLHVHLGASASTCVSSDQDALAHTAGAHALHAPHLPHLPHIPSPKEVLHRIRHSSTGNTECAEGSTVMQYQEGAEGPHQHGAAVGNPYASISAEMKKQGETRVGQSTGSSASAASCANGGAADGGTGMAAADTGHSGQSHGPAVSCYTVQDGVLVDVSVLGEEGKTVARVACGWHVALKAFVLSQRRTSLRRPRRRRVCTAEAPFLFFYEVAVRIGA
jgi:hypothetical protein